MDEKVKDLSDFVALGKECGLSGEALVNFAENKLKEYKDDLRDRRAIERDVAKEARAIETAKIEGTESQS